MHHQDPTAPIWVATPTALRRMMNHLLACEQIAVDTESNGLHAYQEQICLIQFSVPGADYLVDPLASVNLSGLNEIFSNPEIEKVFHAAEYDILCLKRDFGFTFTHLFDTMIAARILGRSEVGLAALLEEHFGVTLDKRYQRANWARRPLPPAMLNYARLDTHYLIDLRNRLAKELAERGLTALAKEDFLRVCETPAAPAESRPPMWWDVAGTTELPPQQASLLQALVEFREQQARFANLPPFRVLSNSVLMQIAEANPLTLEDLAEVQGLSYAHFERYGLGIMEALRRGRTRPAPPPPGHSRPNHQMLKRLEMLKRWRKDAGKRLGVESDVILPRDTMHALAQCDVTTPEAIERLMAHLPWRWQTFGKELIQLLVKEKVS